MACVVRVLRDLSVDLSKPLPFENPLRLYFEVSETEEALLMKWFPCPKNLNINEPRWRVCECPNKPDWIIMECGHSHNIEIPEKAVEELRIAAELHVFDKIEIWETRLERTGAAVAVGISSAEFSPPRYYPIVAFGNEEYLDKVSEKVKGGWLGRVVDVLAGIGAFCLVSMFIYAAVAGWPTSREPLKWEHAVARVGEKISIDSDYSLVWDDPIPIKLRTAFHDLLKAEATCLGDKLWKVRLYLRDGSVYERLTFAFSTAQKLIAVPDGLRNWKKIEEY